MIDSISALAKLVGKSKVAVAKWVKRDDWPFGPAPWHEGQVPHVKRWAGNLQADRSAPAPEPADEGTAGLSLKQKLELRKLAATIQKYEAQVKALQADAGEYVARKEVERMNVERIYAVKAELLNTARLAGMLEVVIVPGKLAEAEAIMRKWAKGICDRFAAAAPLAGNGTGSHEND